MKVYRMLFPAIAAMLLTAIAFAAAPRLIAYQGKATTAAGVAVSDGSHPAQFAIYDKYNNLKWSESATVTTSGGLFTHNLGSVTPLNPTQFNGYDSMFLQVTFEGQIQTPRTLFTATPYAYHVHSIEGSQGGVIIGSVSINSPAADDEVAGIEIDLSGNPNLWMKDMDGISRVKLNAATRSLQLVDGEVTLTPATITSQDSTVVIPQARIDNNLTVADSLIVGQRIRVGNSATIRSGGDTLVLGEGKVRIRNTQAVVTGQLNLDGTTDCWINPNTTGISSVFLPDDGINAREISDEPGIASDEGEGPDLLSGTFMDLATISITIPSSGYILLIGRTAIMMEAVAGESYVSRVQIDEPGGVDDQNSSMSEIQVYDKTAKLSHHCQAVYYKPFSGTYAFVLEGKRVGGTSNCRVYTRQLTAVFIPSSYGAVSSIISESLADQFAETIRIRSESVTKYKVDLRELELRAAKAEAEAERARADSEKAQRELLEVQRNLK